MSASLTLIDITKAGNALHIAEAERQNVPAFGSKIIEIPVGCRIVYVQIAALTISAPSRNMTKFIHKI
jgi:hypothetical protein